MAADIHLEKYVTPKKSRGRLYYYFRVQRPGQPEFRRPLPHPFDPDYRTKYDSAHADCFGAKPLDMSDPIGWQALIDQFKASAKYTKVSKASRDLRDLACTLLLDTFDGVCQPRDIKPLHMQALYDTLSIRPPTANRRMDDVSVIFSWGRLRGFCDINPCSRIERTRSDQSYEPWPRWALDKLIQEGRPHIVQPALVALYSGQRRADCLHQLRPAQIVDGIWNVGQGKTKTVVPVPLHPVIMAIVDFHEESMRIAGRIDPNEPVLKTSRGTPWSAKGFGASWNKELIRLGLKDHAPRLTFHGFRTTNATMLASAVAKSEHIYGGIERVQAMLGHLSKSMSEHYARRAITEHKNAESVLLLPTIHSK